MGGCEVFSLPTPIEKTSLCCWTEIRSGATGAFSVARVGQCFSYSTGEKWRSINSAGGCSQPDINQTAPKLNRPAGGGVFLLFNHLCGCKAGTQSGLQMHLLCAWCYCSGRIWPLCYSLCILPDEIVLAEDEEGAVYGEAVLFDRVRVINGHCPGSLGHRLLVHPLAARSATTTPGSPSPSARSASPSAACASSIPGG